VDSGKVYVKEGKRYGVTASNIWRGRWWNYYERGVSYASGDFWEEAMADFQAALKQRQDDQRRARTYGLHFVDYFPHRELGVVLYNLGRHPEAIRELETSLDSVDNAKAKFYLNLARKSLLQQTQRDTAPPRILITTPQDGLLSNRFSVTVSGSVEDDTYVSAIAINGQALFIELAEPRIAFTREIELQEGENHIEVVAVDLLGRLARQRLGVQLDRQGPLLSLDQVEVVGAPPRVRVAGLLADRSRVVRFELAGQRMALQPGATWEFREEVAVQAGAAAIPFEAEDTVGNITRGEITLAAATGGPPGIRKGEPATQPWPRWASLRSDLVLSDLTALPGAPIQVAQGNTKPPVITLRELTAEQTVYYDAIYLEGKVTGSNSITAFTINDESLFQRQSKQIFFAYNAPLTPEPDKNPFVFKAVDETGNTAELAVSVTRKVPQIKRRDARLRLMFIPFENKGELYQLGRTVDDNLYNSLFEQARFQLVERDKLQAILAEQKLSQSDLADPATRIRVGKIAAAEAMLEGTINETPQAIEVFGKVIDLETTKALAAEDVYGEGMDLRQLRQLMTGLAAKFRQRLPLVEGLVIQNNGAEVTVDIGSNRAIRESMKLYIFREGKALKHPVTGKILGAPTTSLGEARITAVYDEFSQATLVQEPSSDAIQQLDKVITK
jgi:tetratricopeptide (TPR) repeat protein